MINRVATTVRGLSVSTLLLNASVTTVLAGAVWVGTYVTVIDAQGKQIEQHSLSIKEITDKQAVMAITLERIDTNVQWLRSQEVLDGRIRPH